MKELNIFKIEYDWYEGEHGEVLLGKSVKRKEFEKDLIKAKNFAKSLIGKEIKLGEYLGKGYTVQCLLQYYNQIIWFLEKKLGYIICYLDKNICYSIEDFSENEIYVNKIEDKRKTSKLKC